MYTGFAFRFKHRKCNIGRNRLPKLVHTIAPSVPFPVFKSEGEPGTCNPSNASLPFWLVLFPACGCGSDRAALRLSRST